MTTKQDNIPKCRVDPLRGGAKKGEVCPWGVGTGHKAHYVVVTYHTRGTVLRVDYACHISTHMQYAIEASHSARKKMR